MWLQIHPPTHTTHREPNQEMVTLNSDKQSQLMGGLMQALLDMNVMFQENEKATAKNVNRKSEVLQTTVQSMKQVTKVQRDH